MDTQCRVGGRVGRAARELQRNFAKSFNLLNEARYDVIIFRKTDGDAQVLIVDESKNIMGSIGWILDMSSPMDVIGSLCKAFEKAHEYSSMH
ncbi:MAG: hypothetical protein PHC64_04220 [Candidatus Gastranaerophilales bacterium]|nr:hypothetical protein [Candidatus Gastranaerophilales bacterium]